MAARIKQFSRVVVLILMIDLLLYSKVNNYFPPMREITITNVAVSATAILSDLKTQLLSNYEKYI
jgi:hypothetical protein